MQVEIERVTLPSGKEAKFTDALSFCYGITDTDFKVLLTLIQRGSSTEGELTKILNLSKASLNRSLNKLLFLGFIEREKIQSPKGGRPKYLYKSVEKDVIIKKITEDFKGCAEVFSNRLPAFIHSVLDS